MVSKPSFLLRQRPLLRTCLWAMGGLYSLFPLWAHSAPPTADFKAVPTNGPPPLTLVLDASASSDQDDFVKTYEWSVNGQPISLGTINPNYEMTEASVDRVSGQTVTRRVVVVVINTPGTYSLGLKTTDNSSEFAVGQPANVTVGPEQNNPPVACFTATPAAGPAPLDVIVEYSCSTDSDGMIDAYEWSVDGSPLSGSTTGAKKLPFPVTGNYVLMLKVTDNKGATDNTAHIISVTAATYSLSISKTGAGTGTITATGIDCGIDCSENYAAGVQVDLTAKADADSTFTGWSGACEGADVSTSLPMNAHKSCKATFDKAKAKHTLSVNISGSGKVTSFPGGIICSTSDCTKSLESGKTVYLSATPEIGYTFSGWSGACTGTAAANVTMTADKNCSALFTPSKPSISITPKTLNF